jgi:replication factor C large subunit
VAWVDENLPREYRDDDLERGCEALSKADMFLGRVRRRMDYGMWRYASFMMVTGVNRARKHRYGGYTKFNTPTYWQKLGRAKSSRTIRDSIASKIGKYCHTSKREARAFYIPLLRTVFKDEEYAVGLTARLKLEEDEIAFLLDAEKSSKKVEKIYEKSRDLIAKEVEHEIDVFGRFAAPAPKPEEPVAEKPPEKPKRKRKVSRDGGDEAPVEAPPEPAAPVVEEVEIKDESPPPESKKQRTLFEF